MFVRRFQNADLKRVYEIEKLSFLDPYDMEVLLRIYELGLGFLVAEESNQVVGYIIFSLTNECDGHLVSIAVDKNYRGLKIGSALLRAVISTYLNIGINKIVLEVRTHNIRAIKFYESFGFIIDRKEFKYYENGDDAYVMYLKFPS